MKTPGNTPPNDDQPVPDFEHSQDAQDLMLLTELANDFGSPGEASNIVCLVETIGGAETDADKFVRDMVQAREDGKLHNPALLALTDEEYEERVRQDGRQTATRMAERAKHRLAYKLDGVSSQEQGVHVRQLLSILGVRQADEEFFTIPRDEERARKLIEVAKLMDPAYRQFAGLNPEFVEEVDPASASALRGVPIEDPELREIHRRLREGPDSE